jgi:iron complex outermembrane receptor protein
VGYTYFRLRGTDHTRINATINDVPLNDGESQTVFWVNLTDLASSTTQLQVQRGVGTSTNGSASFGGSINMQTTDPLTASPSNRFTV